MTKISKSAKSKTKVATKSNVKNTAPKKTVKTKSEIKNKHLPTYYKKIVGDEDLITSGVFFQATKIVSLK